MKTVNDVKGDVKEKFDKKIEEGKKEVKEKVQ
jgi:hypothetical protein